MFTSLNDSQETLEPVDLSAASPGDMLRMKREAMGVTLVAAASRTRISQTTLFHLESNLFDEFGAELFVRGHLKSYARELGIDADVISHSYERYIQRQGPTVYAVEEEVDPIDASELPVNVTRSTSPHNAVEGNPSPRASQKKRLSDGALALDATKGRPLTVSLFDTRVTYVGDGVPRKVIGRFDRECRRTGVRRGLDEAQPSPRATGRLTGGVAAIAERILTKPESEATVTSEVSLRETRRADLSDSAYGLPAVPRETLNPYKGLQPQSKMERAIPQLKQFGAKHFLVVIALIFAGVVVAGMVSGNRATAQDPAKFPKNAQDSWELERRAEQTRWLLEQPEGTSAKNPSAPK